MSKPSTDFVRWSEVVRSMNVDADALPQSPVPLHVLFGEAVDVARFFEKYYKTQAGEAGAVVRRGLDSVAGRGKGKGGRRIGPRSGKEILSIQRAAQEAQTRYLLTVDSKAEKDPAERGRFLLAEIKAALRYHFDDGVTDERDTQFARVNAAHEEDPRSADAIAAAIEDHAALAATYVKELDGLGGFSAAYIEEARKVAATLREKPTRAAATGTTSREALDLRNRLVALLLERIAIVRAAARFVFRDRPEIVREATSEYARKRRAEARRSQETPPPASAVG